MIEGSDTVDISLRHPGLLMNLFNRPRPESSRLFQAFEHFFTSSPFWQHLTAIIDRTR